MNLHIGVDNLFIEKLYDNLAELGILGNNKIIIRSPDRPKHIRRDVLYAPLYSKEFELLAGDTSTYERVVIHQFSPLMYRWVANHSFKTLDWAVWGVDLYDLPFVNYELYEPYTRSGFIKGNDSLNDILYSIKYLFTNSMYRNKAFRKVTNLLTWMDSEYEFARQNIPAFKGNKVYFFYENTVSYEELYRHVSASNTSRLAQRKRLIVGNSATPTNNHIDVLRFLQNNGIEADVIIPLSYGDDRYSEFLRKNVAFYKNGSVEFMEKRLDFNSYLEFLNNADALVMNNIRPQGYGNIFIMLALGKRVFLNNKNVSVRDLTNLNIPWYPIQELKSFIQANRKDPEDNQTLFNLLSHKKNLEMLSGLFQ